MNFSKGVLRGHGKTLSSTRPRGKPFSSHLMSLRLSSYRNERNNERKHTRVCKRRRKTRCQRRKSDVICLIQYRNNNIRKSTECFLLLLRVHIDRREQAILPCLNGGSVCCLATGSRLAALDSLLDHLTVSVPISCRTPLVNKIHNMPMM